MQFFKRLEIHGFKSFANRTVIDFHPGVTVIVGPNGCGKSNVFDSIRWVLGEQSAKSLRGSRMGDVIFNGSGGQKAMGMAKVALTLNNANRHLPLDYDEVEISRRLFKTGESEYALNKQQCRLKDIILQFMDTGIGTDSYSVLEQGKVDAIINSRPLERRSIFDEAAGISKYKARKDEALNKLRRTEDDLVRLTDIINEVRRQSGKLQRQAQKAERYQALTAELKYLEMELLIRRFFQFQESSAASEEYYHQLSARVEKFRADIKAVEEEQTLFRSKVEEVQQSLEDNQALNFELNKELQETLGKIALLEQRQENNSERKQNLQQQIDDFTKNYQELVTARDENSVVLKAEEEELERLRIEQKEKQARYEALKGDADQSSEAMARLRQEISQKTRGRMEKENQISVARVMEEKLAEELSHGDTELQALKDQLDALETEFLEKQQKSEFSDQERDRLNREAAAAREDFRTKELDLYNSSTDLEQARRQAHETQSRHDALADLQESFEGYFRGVKEVMLAGKNKKLRGLIGVVTTLIEAKKEHETAIEVALGAQAQDIVTDTAEDAKAAIRWLKDNRIGRATFLPLDLIEGRENHHSLNKVVGQKGVIGFATDLVKYNPRLQNVVKHLLGNVVVVQNLDVAVQLERQGIRTKFVTLEGEMVSASGAMTGGNMKVAGLLNRTREIKELADKHALLKAKEKELTDKVALLKTGVQQMRELSEKLARQAQAQEIEAARAKKDFETADHRVKDKAQQLAKVDQRRAGMEKDLAGHRLTQSEGAVILKVLTEEVEVLEKELAGIEVNATARQQEVADAARDANEVMVKLSTGTERVRHLTERVETAIREIKRLEETQDSKREEIARLEQEFVKAAEELEKLREESAGIRKHQEDLLGQITNENEQKESVQTDLRNIVERSQALHRDYNEAQNELHEVELKRREFILQLENIQIQAHEKFSYTLEEVVQRVLMPSTVVEKEEEEEPENEEEISAEEDGEDADDEDFEDEDYDDDDEDSDDDESIESEEPQRREIPVFDINSMGEEAQENYMKLRKPEEIAEFIRETRSSIDALGPVHIGAIDEYKTATERLDFLVNQENDLNEAKAVLAETISKIDETSQDLFTKAFTEIRANFEQVYRRLFGGGRADLILTEENGVLESGIDIVAQPPGKKPQHISLLSGGEKALTAVALLFAIFMRKPSPFCILDEIDAPLDDKNIERFKSLVQEFTDTTQFIVITHNKQTMQLANTIYGVTMEEQGVSRVVSIKLDEIDDNEVVKEMENDTVAVG